MRWTLRSWDGTSSRILGWDPISHTFWQIFIQSINADLLFQISFIKCFDKTSFNQIAQISYFKATIIEDFTILFLKNTQRNYKQCQTGDCWMIRLLVNAFRFMMVSFAKSVSMICAQTRKNNSAQCYVSSTTFLFHHLKNKRLNLTFPGK